MVADADASDRDGALPIQVDPRAPDAGLAAEASTAGDASLPDDARVDDTGAEAASWKDRLRGRYALRIRNYSRVQALEGLAALANEVLWLADVAIEADGRVMMTTRVCQDRTHIGMSFLGESWAEMVSPEVLAGRRFELLYVNGQFRTEGAPALHGYTDDVPPECAPGRTAAARPDQVWLRNGTCDCPSATTPPTSPNDCRVTNPDDDAFPGYTIRLSGGFTGFDYIRNKDASQFEEGRIDPDKRHSARYTRIYDFYQLGCARPPCARSSPEFCPSVPNVVEFAPLTEPLTCAELVRQTDDGRLFRPEPLRAPAGCSG